MSSVLALTGCEPPDERAQPVNVEAAIPPPVPSQAADWNDPACEPDQAGEFTTIGNRHARYGHVCSQEVSLTFEAFPAAEDRQWNLGYFIQSRRCTVGFPEADQEALSHLFDGKALPDGFFDLPASRQVDLLKANLRSDLADFARHCDLDVDREPFVGEAFADFYMDFADGWWLTR